MQNEVLSERLHVRSDAKYLASVLAFYRGTDEKSVKAMTGQAIDASMPTI